MDVVVQKPKPPRETPTRQVTEGRRSTFYNPVRTSLSEVRLADQLCPFFDTLPWPDRPQFAQMWSIDSRPELVDSKIGLVAKGSVLSYQHKVCASDAVFLSVGDAPEPPIFSFPDLSQYLKPYLPMPYNVSMKFNSLFVSESQICEYEKSTRQQSQSLLWQSLRQPRLTASNFKSICSRRADFDGLAKQMAKKRIVQTAAMKFGLENEPVAAEMYVKLFGVNAYSVGLVIHPQCVFLGCSPDRRIYDPDNEVSCWGFLEIKCTTAASVADCDYLKHPTKLQLKRTHAYFFQVMGQMGLTGTVWCDFFVFARDDYHCERIMFRDHIAVFNNMMEKLCFFFFNHYVAYL